MGDVAFSWHSLIQHVLFAFLLLTLYELPPNSHREHPRERKFSASFSPLKVDISPYKNSCLNEPFKLTALPVINLEWFMSLSQKEEEIRGKSMWPGLLWEEYLLYYSTALLSKYSYSFYSGREEYFNERKTSVCSLRYMYGRDENTFSLTSWS